VSGPPPDTHMRNYPPFPKATPHLGTDCPRAPHPSATGTPESAPFDLHALGTPPALILSQDQTLHHDLLLLCARSPAPVECPCRNSTIPPDRRPPTRCLSLALLVSEHSRDQRPAQGFPPAMRRPPRLPGFTPSSAHTPALATPERRDPYPSPMRDCERNVRLAALAAPPQWRHRLRPALFGTGGSLSRREPADDNDSSTHRQATRPDNVADTVSVFRNAKL
jgi:hypothetical protein